MAAVVARRWQCCEASILLRPKASISLRSVGCWFFSGFLVDCGCGSVGFDLDQLVFLVHWWVLMILPPIGWVMIWLDWVSGWVGD